ncbi:hypothetical protein [Streptosporangium longisporum]|uniref:hypothetical protein n=1 Tax=Streptosporangium longisporum TaxID=46187 RepID=UPI0031EA1C4B
MRRKPLVSHCTVVVATSRSSARSRRATLRIVSLRIMTKADRTRIASTRPVRDPPGGPGTSGVAAGVPAADAADGGALDTMTSPGIARVGRWASGRYRDGAAEVCRA